MDRNLTKSGVLLERPERVNRRASRERIRDEFDNEVGMRFSAGEEHTTVVHLNQAGRTVRKVVSYDSLDDYLAKNLWAEALVFDDLAPDGSYVETVSDRSGKTLLGYVLSGAPESEELKGSVPGICVIFTDSGPVITTHRNRDQAKKHFNRSIKLPD